MCFLKRDHCASKNTMFSSAHNYTNVDCSVYVCFLHKYIAQKLTLISQLAWHADTTLTSFVLPLLLSSSKSRIVTIAFTTVPDCVICYTNHT